MNKAFFALAALAMLFACTPEAKTPDDMDEPGGDGKANLAPSVTVEASHVSAISAVLAGKANLGATVAADLQVGFQYSKSAGILPSNSTTIEATDADANYNYTASITGLEPDTKYYFRSFVRQNSQYTYGETKEFTTKEISSVLETLDATGVEATSAILNAKLDLTDVKYENIRYGFYWGTSESSQDTFINGEAKDKAMTASMTGLNHKTQYWYKAYVKLDNQSFFGEVKTFTTDVVKVESVSLDKTEYTFNTIGNTLTLKATVLPAEATDKSVEWSSDNEDVATVDNNGRVTAKGNGKAVITVRTKDQEKTATCEVEVRQYVTGITLGDLDLVIGDNITASYSITPSNAYNSTLIWSSDNTTVAEVTDNGAVTAKSKGKATIMASANDGSGVTAICNVVVSTPAPEGAVYMGTHTSDGYRLYWATSNLSSSGLCANPEDYGDYYAWGEVEPYYSSQNPITWKDGKTAGYNWASYKWCNGAFNKLTKYCHTDKTFYWDGEGSPDGKTVLEPEDDAAHVSLGGKWRMPTDAEWRELTTECTWKWTTQNGVNGRLVTGPNDNSIFLPAAGRWKDTNLGYYTYGYYWTSSLHPVYPIALYALFDSYMWGRHSDSDRYYGFSIRPVSE